MNESPIHEVAKNGGFIFHMGQVSELWRKAMVNNCHVFDLSNCSVVFKCKNSFGTKSVSLLK